MTLKAQRYRDKLLKESRKGFCGYPVATVAFYGPDDTRATKVSVGIIADEDANADPVEWWFPEVDELVQPSLSMPCLLLISGDISQTGFSR
ncbi:hypothetical protein [Paraburkholderia sp. LEh10]|uniref:hypothetical protein n=1 Tax=Paraburkholderia sp. LEh10 TaxID=2821353 RepID=UPI001FD73FE7|nr:hypothetical protein [Paraburkholderia sp. LEh10]